jgi:hypothetical protein
MALWSIADNGVSWKCLISGGRNRASPPVANSLTAKTSLILRQVLDALSSTRSCHGSAKDQGYDDKAKKLLGEWDGLSAEAQYGTEEQLLASAVEHYQTRQARRYQAALDALRAFNAAPVAATVTRAAA